MVGNGVRQAAGWALCLQMMAGGWAAAEEQERPWALTGSGGVALLDGAAPYGGLQLTRTLDAFYVSGGVSYAAAARQEQASAFTALPSRTIGGNLAVGREFGPVTIEARGFYGRRRGDPVAGEVAGPQGGAIAFAVEPTGRSISAGGALSAVFGNRVLFVPYVAADWSSVTTFQTASFAAGQSRTVSEQTESGVSGAVGLAISTALDPAQRFWVSPRASLNGATNAAAVDFTRERQANATGLSQGLNTTGNDGWAEFGGDVSYDVSEAATLSFSATQTVSVATGDATTLSGALTLRF